MLPLKTAIIQKIKKFVTDSDYRFIALSEHEYYRNMPDSDYIKRLYKAKLGEYPDLDHPRTFNEKLQWLKLHDHRPEYSLLVDKYTAKEYVSSIIGEEYIIPTLGVWDQFEEIDFDTLPNQFVLKCTHDSGGLVICKDKAALDIGKAKKKIQKALRHRYYFEGREWPYKNVVPRIIAEKYMQDHSNDSGDESDGLTDYKFYCFNGEPKYLYVSRGLDYHPTAEISFLNLDWSFAPFGRSDFKPFSELPKKPEKFNEMLDISRKLSNGIPFLRVDLYEVDGRVFFSELTFSPCSGMMPFSPKEYDLVLGNQLILP